ncbi:putative cyclin-dependent kinase F-2 [Zea mays]|uniref:Putative cyclin-dependent kinase F-2 n=1 Tax=Zea mays TaxID=4577 RepID=A0A3L6DLL4_MAIZE|nr:putative cyclin-dependent kinase F-2 [Zea mays]
MAELVTGTGVPFFGGALDKEVFDKVLHVVGTRGIAKWQGLERVAPREKVACLRKTASQERGYLLKMFPPRLLSPAGFKVLEGLLQSNPDHRLSAADALRKPWFRRRFSLGACCFMPHALRSRLVVQYLVVTPINRVCFYYTSVSLLRKCDKFYQLFLADVHVT